MSVMLYKNNHFVQINENYLNNYDVLELLLGVMY
ncbi:unnamed protein product [Trichobilharzia regenti]|nr:unnamed protein product [Trichobilharzia regenti]